jgi:hypothetical protein
LEYLHRTVQQFFNVGCFMCAVGATAVVSVADTISQQLHSTQYIYMYFHTILVNDLVMHAGWHTATHVMWMSSDLGFFWCCVNGLLCTVDLSRL